MASYYASGKKKRLVLRFRYKMRECKEATPYYCEKDGAKDCKCRSCKSAHALALEIERKISDKAFNYADYFPKSKAFTSFLPNTPEVQTKKDYTYKEYWKKWFDLTAGVKKATVDKYKTNAIRPLEFFGNKNITDIKYSDVQTLIKYMEDIGLAPKTIKGIFANVSAVFRLALEDDDIDRNPCVSKNPKHKIMLPAIPQSDPDPFSLEELNRIINWVEKNHPERVLYFAIAFLTGMRPSEIIALRWGNINLEEKYIDIKLQHTKGRIELPKTNRLRRVQIISALAPFIENHKPYTIKKSDYVFLTQYGKPYMWHRDFERRCWTNCLKALNIRRRPLKQTRHTFACTMLQQNINREWIFKKMLGHTNTEMLEKVYGNYMPNNLSEDNFEFINTLFNSKLGN
jgi:integrase